MTCFHVEKYVANENRTMGMHGNLNHSINQSSSDLFLALVVRCQSIKPTKRVRCDLSLQAHTFLN
jgi:hypothetical protein